MSLTATSQSHPVDQELPRRPAKVLQIANGHGPLATHYWTSRWAFLDQESELVRCRTTDILIRSGEEAVGRCRVTEYRLEPFTHPGDFLAEMDDHSGAAAELATILCRGWDDPSELTDYGDIVEISRVRMRPHLSGRRRLLDTLVAMLNVINPNRSLLILKAFPLEYEGAGETSGNARFLRRHAAMKRHYATLLGVRSLPGPSGDEGWMYAIPDRLSGIVEAPRAVTL